MKTALTKSDEIAALRAFVASLPENSYLADSFAGAVAEFERAIRSDYIVEFKTAMPAAIDEHRAMDKRIHEARKELQALRESIQGEQNRLDRIRRDYKTARETLDAFGDKIRSALAWAYKAEA